MFAESLPAARSARTDFIVGKELFRFETAADLVELEGAESFSEAVHEPTLGPFTGTHEWELVSRLGSHNPMILREPRKERLLI